MTAGGMTAVGATALILAACSGGSGEAETESSTSATATTDQVLPEIEGAPPTADSLVGTWTRIGEALLFRFTEDGTFAFDRSNPDVPFASGTYEVDGNNIRFTSTGPGCVDTWAWQAGITEREDPLDDEMNVVFTEAGCEELSGTEWMFARLALK